MIGKVMENTSKNGRFKGQQGKVVKQTDKALCLLMFSDRVERWFQLKYLTEVVPDDAFSSGTRTAGKKAKRDEPNERYCEVDEIVMAFHRGLPAKSRVTENELIELVSDLMRLFE